NTIQLLHFRADLNQSQEGAPMNFQFIIDALSNEEKSDTKTNFRINSLIVREGEVCFDKLYLPKKGSFDINHILIRELDAHLSLKSIVSDSIRLRLRQLSFKEQSGLDLRNMSFTVTANQHEALVTQFLLNFPHTTLKADTLHTFFDLNAKDVLNAMHSHAKLEISPLTLSDFAFIVPKLSNFDERINSVIDVQQEGREIVVNNIQIATESQNIQFQSHARVHLPADSLDALTASTEIQQLIVQPSAYPMLFNNLQLGNTPPMLTRLGRIQYAGELKATGDGLHSAGIWNTAAGQVRTDMVFTTEKKIRGAIETENLNVGQLTGNQKLGEIAGRVQFNGLFINGKPSGKVLGDISSFEYNNY
ncbi:MAG: hypothetical protein HUJ98_15125, partial [Bacteroidaceae bacterium]|nr:hypothetical protein [Bacteroidaceae bacterium]